MKSPCFFEECLESGACGRMAATIHQLATTLGRAVDAKDKRLFAHSALTADLATVLAQTHGLTTRQVELVHLAGHLHDIGKIGIPDAVLLKPGRLDHAEWDMMHRHPALGADILKPTPFFQARNGVADMVLTHHESYDGGGYPQGLSGRDIPLGGRILAVADSLAAMLEQRVYRPAMTLPQALEEIERCSGIRYDPDLCRDLLSSIVEIEAVVACNQTRSSDDISR